MSVLIQIQELFTLKAPQQVRQYKKNNWDYFGIQN